MNRTVKNALAGLGAAVIVVSAMLAISGCGHSDRMSAPPPTPPAHTSTNAIANDPNIPPQIKAQILARMGQNPAGPQRPGGFVPGHPMTAGSKATKS